MGINLRYSPLEFSDTTKQFTSNISTSAVSGNIRHTEMNLTMGRDASVGNVEALRVRINSNYKTGAWANAIVGSINYDTNGAAHGMAAAVCGEMIPPNGSLRRGALYGLDVEFGCGASSTWASAGPVAFIKMENWGTATHFSANAFLLHLAGETAAAGGLVSATTTTLRTRIGTVTRYIPLSTTEDGLTLASTWVTADATGRPMSSHLTTNVTLGSYANALKGNVDLSATGGTTGLLSAVCAEITMATAGTSGTYAAVELEMTYGATNGALPKPCFIYANTAGTAKTDFDTYGDFMKIGTGVTAGAGKMLSAGSHTLRVGTGALGATKRYIFLSDSEESLTMGTTGGSGTTLDVGTVSAEWHGIEMSIVGDWNGEYANGIRCELEDATGTAGSMIAGRFDAKASFDCETVNGINATAQILGSLDISNRFCAGYISLYGAAGETVTRSGGSIYGLFIQHYLRSDPGANTGSYPTDFYNAALGISMPSGTYCDYGVVIKGATSNVISAIFIGPTDSSVWDYGIQFANGTPSGNAGTITSALYFETDITITNFAKWESAANGIAANTSTLTLAPTSHHLVLDIAGTAYYVPVFDNTSWT